MNCANENIKQRKDELPRVTAVILNYNGYEDTVKCIRSLQNSTYSNLSFVLVDNGSPDDSGLRLKAEFPNLPIILIEENTGYAAGNNLGIRFAVEKGTDYVLVINNDVIVEPTFLEPMVNSAEKQSAVGMVTCKVYYQSVPNEIFSSAGKMNWWLCTGVNKGNYLKFMQKAESLCYTDFACGVLVLMRNSMLEEAGLFDEKYFMYFEDVEYSLRISSKYKIVYVPSAVAYHKSGGGKGWLNYTELYLYYHTRNRIWAFETEPWYYRFYVIIFTVLISAIKSLVILINLFNYPRKTPKQLWAIWQGLRDGILAKK
ncbi:MAG: glycosyltransferase family 2 protein [Bacteroidota bacterium]|nr:glycosyltransferase family 2 protein [Bacteroidota bacterium]